MTIETIVIVYLAAALFVSFAVRNPAYDARRYLLVLALSPLVAAFLVGTFTIDIVTNCVGLLATRGKRDKKS